MDIKEGDLAHYRGLVISTAAMVVRRVDMEFDDIVQVLWIKVWQAIEKHDPARSTKTCDEYVFGCLMNQKIDLFRRRRSRTVGFDDLGFQSEDRRDRDLGMVVEEEVVYGPSEEAELVLPNTLTEPERTLIELLTGGYRQAEAARSLGWSLADMARTMRSIREKLADWAPSAEQQAREDTAPLSELACGAEVVGRGAVVPSDEPLAA